MLDYIDIIISFSLIILGSYFFQYLTTLLKIPSVIFLIVSGIGIRLLFNSMDIPVFDYEIILQILGTVGLVLIVLEGSLDLHLSKNKKKLIASAFFNAVLIFAITVVVIFLAIKYFYNIDFFSSLLYSIPLSTVSSAIAIPTVAALEKKKKEFILFETTFSDILGIMVFNFCFLEATGPFGLITSIVLSIVITIVLAIVLSFFLVYISAKNKVRVKFFFIMALLMLIYALGKKMHLPSLFIVLVFGLLLRNIHLFKNVNFLSFIKPLRINEALHEIEYLTIELAFLVRTFFFLLFGYSIDLNLFEDPDVWYLGSIILLIIFLMRFVTLKLIYHEKNIFPELFIAPRGLITVLLFYSIPAPLIVSSFNVGVVYFVIIASNLAMMLAMIFSKKDVPLSEEEI